jgi:tryptophanyl-tRNA synthetase
MKKQLAEDLVNTLAPIRERIIEISSDQVKLEKIAQMGAEKARESASATLREVRKIIGFKVY